MDLARIARRLVIARQIAYGDEGTGLTWQADFPATTPCEHCGADARLAFTLLEEGGDDGYICDLHDNEHEEGGEGFWLHDAGAFALYICTDIDCVTKTGGTTTLWNQA
jgi:hypothetical protein